MTEPALDSYPEALGSRSVRVLASSQELEEQISETAQPSVEELLVEERVANGMSFLDERVPGWRERVNPDTLDLGASCGCVLGQIFGSCYADWEDMSLQLGVTYTQARRMGFWSSPDAGYDDLDAAWKRALA